MKDNTTESLSTISAMDAFRFATRNLAENEGLVGAPDDDSSLEKRIALGSFADAVQVLNETGNPEVRELGAKLLRLSAVTIALEEDRVFLAGELQASGASEHGVTSATPPALNEPLSRHMVG